MNNFTLFNPTRILFGTGRIADIAGEVPANARILITYGGGSIVKTGTLAEVKAALNGFTLFEFAGIEPNPTYETLMQAVELARRGVITRGLFFAGTGRYRRILRRIERAGVRVIPEGGGLVVRYRFEAPREGG